MYKIVLSFILICVFHSSYGQSKLLNTDPKISTRFSELKNQDFGYLSFQTDIKKHKISNSVMFQRKYNATHLPIFCEIEHKIFKSSGLQLKFRLGSLKYVDYLEKK